jgi:hypothetical protein
MAEPRLKLFDSIEMHVVSFGAVTGTTASVKSSDGIRTASPGIDELEIPVFEASTSKQAFVCIFSRKEIGIVDALCLCAVATG